MASKRRSRWSAWVITLLLVVAAIGGIVWYRAAKENAAPDYETAQIVRGDLTQVVTATGQLNPVVNVQVGSQISGKIRKIYVDYNSVVKSNEVIAEVDPSTYKVNVLKAKAELANAKATLELNQVEARRADALFKEKLISTADHDTAIAQLHEAEAQVQSDEASLKNAEVQLSYCTIHAPVDGIVISRNVDVGQTVAASFNTPTLFVIANDLSKMQIDALISEADIGGVAVGQRVDFTVDAYPYRTFHGVVRQIRYGPVTNQNVVNYDAVIDVKNTDLKLLPGMTANVSIVVAERTNALMIPNSALRFRPPEAALADLDTNAIVQSASASVRASGNPRRGVAGRGARASGARGSRLPGAVFGTPPPDRPVARTVYTLDTAGDPEHPELKPVKIKTGINDGVNTEVVSGLRDGQEVVTGVVIQDSQSRPVNPFMRRRHF